ncbi:MAG: LITAF-like zinc ribbon domain-containing protein [Pyrinomonadaceae bacterium]
MIQCQNCGQVNTETSNFCRFCGTKFLQSQYSNGNNYDFSPPRPYSWKTDEFQISENKMRKTRQINQVQPLVNQTLAQPPRPQPLVYQQPNNMAAYGSHCPRCSAQLFPRYERKISTAGWIVFAVLLVVFFPLFWIGLLIKEDIRVCPVCNLRIS